MTVGFQPSRQREPRPGVGQNDGRITDSNATLIGGRSWQVENRRLTG
jgi:hypothetical protein